MIGLPATVSAYGRTFSELLGEELDQCLDVVGGREVRRTARSPAQFCEEAPGLVSDLVQHGAAPSDERVGRMPHAFAESDDEIVELDSGVEVVDVTALLERAGEERDGRADVAIGLSRGVSARQRFDQRRAVPTDQDA